MFFSLITVIVAAIPSLTAMAFTLPADTTSGLSRRAVYNCSDSTKQSTVTTAYTQGKQLASAASSYITAHGADSLYQSYFGTTPTSQITWLYDQIANESGTNFTLLCDWDAIGDCGASTLAYTQWSTTSCITNGVSTPCAWKARTVFCPLFYSETPLSAVCSQNADGSQASTVVHEMTHALGRTSDYPPYTCTNAQALAATNSTRAADNAQNYGCFSTAVYKAAHC